MVPRILIWAMCWPTVGVWWVGVIKQKQCVTMFPYMTMFVISCLLSIYIDKRNKPKLGISVKRIIIKLISNINFHKLIEHSEIWFDQSQTFPLDDIFLLPGYQNQYSSIVVRLSLFLEISGKQKVFESWRVKNKSGKFYSSQQGRGPRKFSTTENIRSFF